MSFTLQDLADEINADALGIYPAITPENDAAIADAINETRESITVWRDDLEAAELKDAVRLDDYIAACDTAAKRAWFALVLDNGIPLQDPNGAVRSGIASLFAGTDTLTDFVAIAQRSGSRAEALWGPGSFVTPSQVAQARAL